MALSVTKAFPPSKGSRAPDALLRQLALLHIRTDVGGAAPTDQLPNTFNMFRSTELQRSRVVGPLIQDLGVYGKCPPVFKIHGPFTFSHQN